MVRALREGEVLDRRSQWRVGCGGWWLWWVRLLVEWWCGTLTVHTPALDVGAPAPLDGVEDDGDGCGAEGDEHTEFRRCPRYHLYCWLILLTLAGFFVQDLNGCCDLYMLGI